MAHKIMQHCFGEVGSGGPVGAFERLLANSALSYAVIRQTKPAGGVSLALLRRFITEIKAYQPDLIHIRGLGNEGFHAVLAAKLAGVPNILVSIHGTHRDLQTKRFTFRHWIVVNILEKLTLILATHIATVCHFAAKRKFLDGYRHKIIGVVPNGIDVPNNITDTNNIRQKLGISKELPLAICVSRITPEKGYLVLADALTLLDEATIPFGVVVVGGGDTDGRIQALFSTLKNIRIFFVGHQKNVASYLAESDFFVFPSLHENLSNALIEAMAYCLPVIATDVGGNTEVVNHGGGVLVPASNPEKLAQAIKHFVTHSSIVKSLGSEAQQNVLNNYTTHHMVKGWENMYATILEKHHVREV